MSESSICGMFMSRASNKGDMRERNDAVSGAVSVASSSLEEDCCCWGCCCCCCCCCCCARDALATPPPLDALAAPSAPASAEAGVRLLAAGFADGRFIAGVFGMAVKKYLSRSESLNQENAHTINTLKKHYTHTHYQLPLTGACSTNSDDNCQRKVTHINTQLGCKWY